MIYYPLEEDTNNSCVNEEELAYDFISPMSDFGFKNFFASGEESKENLIILLNAILHEHLGLEKIVDLKLNPTEDKAENPERKTTFYDIHCTTSSGSHLIVEMQNKYEDNFLNRMFFYGVEAVMSQDYRKKRRRAWNFELVPVITIALCDFSLPGFTKQPVACFNLRDIYTDKEYGRQFQLVYIHMTEFTNDPTKCKTELEKIIYSLKNMEKIQRMKKVPFSNGEDFYYRLALKSRISALSYEEKVEYNRWLKHEYDRFLREEKMKEEAQSQGMEKGLAVGIERGLAEGRAKGIEEGRAKGIEEGRAEGRAEGIAEEKKEIAKTALQMNLKIEEIVKLTGLSEEEIMNLR